MNIVTYCWHGRRLDSSLYVVDESVTATDVTEAIEVGVAEGRGAC